MMTKHILVLRLYTYFYNISELVASLICALTSVTINTILDMIVDNITIFLSIGGLFAGLLDWVSDKKLNNKIKLDFYR